jgi:hypothetical protein
LSGPALSPHDIAALWGLEAFILSHPEGSYLRRVFSPLADVATSGNLLKVLTGDDLIVSTIEENDLDNLKRRFTRLAPEIFAVWESSLVGPGASLSRFRSTLMSHPVPTGSLTNDTVLRMERPEGFLEAALTRLLLRALNAVPVTFRGRQIPNYWTSNPTLFPIVFESLLANFPSSPPAQEHLLLRSLPLFPPQFLREFAKLSLSASGSMD